MTAPDQSIDGAATKGMHDVASLYVFSLYANYSPHPEAQEKLSNGH